MKKLWLLLALLAVAGTADATTREPRRCAPGTWPTKWTQPAFPTTFEQRSVSSVVMYLAIDTNGSVTFAEVLLVELFPYGESFWPQADFRNALDTAVVSWRFPQQPTPCAMFFKLPFHSLGWWPNNSFKPKPLRGSA